MTDPKEKNIEIPVLPTITDNPPPPEFIPDRIEEDPSHIIPEFEPDKNPEIVPIKEGGIF